MDKIMRRCARTAFMLAPGVLFGVLSLPQIRAGEPEEKESPVHIARGANGRVVLTVDAETQKRIGLEVRGTEATTIQPHTTGYGKLEQDPAESFTLRTPIPGVLRTAPEHSWPVIGNEVGSDTVLGYVEPRFSPLERVDLQSKWMDAQAEVDEVRGELDAARTSFENKRNLNTGGKLVSDRTVEAAQATLMTFEAKLLAAKRKEEMLKDVLSGHSQGAVLFPLEAPWQGEVVAVSVNPGEVVDTGQPLLQLARYGKLIARVALPVGEQIESLSSTARIVLPGESDQVLTAESIGAASKSDPVTMGRTLLYRVTAPPDHQLRPGTAVMAYIPTSGTPLHGVVIPRSAMLRHGGRAWIYVKIADDKFERRDVVLHSPTSGGWFVTSGAADGEDVVADGAQLLLSEELKAQIASEAQAQE